MKLTLKPEGRTFRHHFSYQWWQYALIIVLSFALWNMIYTQTAYRAPGDRRIDIYVQAAEPLSDERIAVLQAIGNRVSPEVEEVNVVSVMPSGAGNMYAGVQLITYLSAREGDIYVLGTEDFKRFAAQGAFLPLDGDGVGLDFGNKNLQAGRVTTLETQEDGSEKPASKSRLFGIPLAQFPEAAQLLGLLGQDAFLSVTYYCDNPVSTLALINTMLKEEIW
ncbi:MAG: hypothetical protein PHP07_01855 [Eubacteriales bacterium]|jgi:hypothetical protein|nr:hypothetical protein [Eubacteriales bacterium]NLO13849.1 hypothetical protein [Clostridiales bacterium]